MVVLVISFCSLHGTLLEMGVGKDELCKASEKDGKHRAWGKVLKIIDFSSLRYFSLNI